MFRTRKMLMLALWIVLGVISATVPHAAHAGDSDDAATAQPVVEFGPGPGWG